MHALKNPSSLPPSLKTRRDLDTTYAKLTRPPFSHFPLPLLHPIQISIPGVSIGRSLIDFLFSDTLETEFQEETKNRVRYLHVYILGRYICMSKYLICTYLGHTSYMHLTHLTYIHHTSSIYNIPLPRFLLPYLFLSIPKCTSIFHISSTSYPLRLASSSTDILPL